MKEIMKTVVSVGNVQKMFTTSCEVLYETLAILEEQGRELTQSYDKKTLHQQNCQESKVTA